jgi:hypothetical protein
VMINGAAYGADKLALQWATTHGLVAWESYSFRNPPKEVPAGIDVCVFPVGSKDWQEVGKSAGHKRNRAMLNMLDLYYDLGARCALVGFLDEARLGPSSGTKGCLAIARREYAHLEAYDFPRQLVRK